MRKKFLAVALAATMDVEIHHLAQTTQQQQPQMTHRLQRNLTLIQLKTARLSKTSVKITETK